MPRATAIASGFFGFDCRGATGCVLAVSPDIGAGYFSVWRVVGQMKERPAEAIAAGRECQGCFAALAALVQFLVFFSVAKLAGRPGFRLPLSSAARRR